MATPGHSSPLRKKGLAYFIIAISLVNVALVLLGALELSFASPFSVTWPSMVLSALLLITGFGYYRTFGATHQPVKKSVEVDIGQLIQGGSIVMLALLTFAILVLAGPSGPFVATTLIAVALGLTWILNRSDRPPAPR